MPRPRRRIALLAAGLPAGAPPTTASATPAVARGSGFARRARGSTR